MFVQGVNGIQSVWISSVLLLHTEQNVALFNVGICGVLFVRWFWAESNNGVIGSDVPWLACPASNALTWAITVTE